MAFQKRFFVGRTQFAVIRQTLVFRSRHEIEQVFLQIRAGAGNGVDFVLTNHFRERNAELGRAHRARERDHHFAAVFEVVAISLGRVFDDSGVEMPVMPVDKFADWPRFRAADIGGFSCPLSLHAKAIA